jgi:glutamate synthase domain-containing protein 2
MAAWLMRLNEHLPLRYAAWTACGAGLLLSLPSAAQGGAGLLAALVFGALMATGWHDVRQTRHSVLRNYPVIGHLRFLLEFIRPEVRQYFIESDRDQIPFSRQQRALVYQRAKGVSDKRPFGTQLDVGALGYEWLNHSMAPTSLADADFRVLVGAAPTCTQPYSASVFNISAMSFGALSANAILALNAGAKAGGFAHDTGEGSISVHHRQHGGDLIWEIGSGYFGCRHPDGSFSEERFAENARDPQVKLIELKLSQGAKPGHGGVLPGSKVTPEIAAARGVPVGVDCISPSSHSAFDTPVGMLRFIERMRVLSGGKPVGFKLCIGHPWEWFAIAKAMVETDLLPDFIVIDGAEGGRLGAAGKVISAFDIARMMALGADWCNSARGFMFALGCIQAQACHTGHCPTGVTTQDPLRQRALVVPSKAERVHSFHGQTLKALRELVQAAGLRHPGEISAQHIVRRTARGVTLLSTSLSFVKPGELLAAERGEAPWPQNVFSVYWPLARSDSFQPLPAEFRPPEAGSR